MDSDHEDQSGSSAIGLGSASRDAKLSSSVPPAGSSVGQAADDKLTVRMELLISAVEQLSLARTLAELTAIVRSAARRITRADGASFVLRDGELSWYVDEDAIAPLWKGQRFPLAACVSGWSMIERAAAVIPDVYADARVPAEAYRPTFVKSMVMVPIRKSDPVGALGVYWRELHAASDWEVRILQALADSAAVAMENIRVYGELEAQVQRRTAQLEVANRELSAFADSVSHDLKAPLRRILGYSAALEEDCPAQLDETGREYLRLMAANATNMTHMVETLLQLSRWGQAALRRQDIDLSALVTGIVDDLRREDPERVIEINIEPSVRAFADPDLAHIVLANLVRNAWKFTRRKAHARITFGQKRPPRGAGLASEAPIYFVRDNGAGFRAEYADQLFLPFRRLHSEQEFPGTGIGLATVQRIVHRHEGRVWAESAAGEGACFFWTLTPTSLQS